MKRCQNQKHTFNHYGCTSVIIYKWSTLLYYKVGQWKEETISIIKKLKLLEYEDRKYIK